MSQKSLSKWMYQRAAISKGAIVLVLMSCFVLAPECLHASSGPTDKASPGDFENDISSTSTATYSVLYDFQGGPQDGSSPRGALLRDGAGSLYGTTTSGGQFQEGTVFRLTAKGTETIYSFQGFPNDGESPVGALIQDSEGNMYGTTSLGGISNAGTVFRIDKGGQEQILHNFKISDGLMPYAGLVIDGDGTLYGTTLYGGNLNCGNDGCGEVFKLDTSGNLTVLYAFNGSTDGAFPYAELVLDAKGNLYSTTQYGGDGLTYNGNGVVFKVSPKGRETVLHTFAGGQDGSNPDAGLIFDGLGNLYGTTLYGGGKGSCGGLGCGTVFKLDHATGQESIVRSFVGDENGGLPGATLLLDNKGDIYGTTLYGGDLSIKCFKTEGCGVVYQLDTGGRETVLHAFTLFQDGGFPNVGLIRDSQGNVYGTAYLDGSDQCSCGLVYKITP